MTACDCDDKRMYEALLKSSDAFHNAYSKLTGDIAHNVLCVTMANVDAIREVAPWVNDCIHVFAVFVRQPHPNQSQKISDEQTYKLAWVFDHDDCYTSNCDGERFAAYYCPLGLNPDSVFKVTRKASGVSELNIHHC